MLYTPRNSTRTSQTTNHKLKLEFPRMCDACICMLVHTNARPSKPSNTMEKRTNLHPEERRQIVHADSPAPDRAPSLSIVFPLLCREVPRQLLSPLEARSSPSGVRSSLVCRIHSRPRLLSSFERLRFITTHVTCVVTRSLENPLSAKRGVVSGSR